MPRYITTPIVVLAALAAPVVVLAQTSLSFHASRDPERDARWLYGGTLGLSSHGFGLRIGGAAGHAPSTIGAGRDLRWTTDADVVLAPTLWGGADARRAIAPYVFAGAGLQSSIGDESTEQAVPHWSWGGGLTIPIVSALSLVGEARSRTLLDPARVGAITTDRRSTELRAGFTLRFGGAPSHRSSFATPASPSSRRTTTATRSGSSIGGTALGTQVLPTARRYLGVRYRYGGTSPTSGFDCSGFVQYVFARHDVALPRTSRQQAAAGTRIEPRLSRLRTGDLMFFAEKGSRVSHVAIYAGDDRIIHSTSTGGEVRYDDLDSSRGKWFATRLVAARRITGGGIDLSDLVRSLESGTVETSGLRLDPPDRAPPPR